MPAKFVDNQIESEDESELNIDLDMLQVPLLKFNSMTLHANPLI